MENNQLLMNLPSSELSTQAWTTLHTPFYWLDKAEMLSDLKSHQIYLAESVEEIILSQEFHLTTQPIEFSFLPVKVGRLTGRKHSTTPQIYTARNNIQGCTDGPDTAAIAYIISRIYKPSNTDIPFLTLSRHNKKDQPYILGARIDDKGKKWLYAIPTKQKIWLGNQIVAICQIHTG